MKGKSFIVDDAKFIFEPFQIEKPSDIMDFIKRYRQLNETYNPYWLEPQVDFHDGNLFFICKGDFDRLIKEKINNSYSEIGLTYLEYVVLRSFVMNTSGLYRLDAYSTIPPIVLSLCNILDEALRKLPRFSGSQLTRECKYGDRSDFHKGEVFVPQYALTTSADLTWNCKDGLQYIISPLKDNSRACEVFHLNVCSEKQVTFLSGTPFIVKDISHPRCNKTIIYFEEKNI